MSETDRRGQQVLRLLVFEGGINLLVLFAKGVVGLATGSMAILADALHSLTDVANNVIAWIVLRASNQPADREHPYGHKKFEMLAVFVLAVLLAVVAVEIAIRAFMRTSEPPDLSVWGLAVMMGVLLVNVALSVWQHYWARRLDSPILRADASHTFSDVLTTVVVIAGWQLSVRGYPWLDTLCALGVAGMILYLAFGLFRNVVPVLVDEIAIEPEEMTAAIGAIEGVISVPRARSRWIGTERAVDVIVTVSPAIDTISAHDIADAVEHLLSERFDVSDSTVHVEPHPQDRTGG